MLILLKISMQHIFLMSIFIVLYEFLIWFIMTSILIFVICFDLCGSTGKDFGFYNMSKILSLSFIYEKHGLIFSFFCFDCYYSVGKIFSFCSKYRILIWNIIIEYALLFFAWSANYHRKDEPRHLDIITLLHKLLSLAHVFI